MKSLLYFLVILQIFKSEAIHAPLPEMDLKAARLFLEELEKNSLKRDVLQTELPKEVSQQTSCHSSCGGSKSNEFKPQKINGIHNLIVFVSFSLGESTLKQLFKDVQKIGGQLVMRGLYKNSFRQTQKKIQDLKIVVDIDPTLFERFQIQEVPTFVLTKGFETEKVPSHDHLKGNISLVYALEVFEQAGHQEAHKWLNKLRETSHV